MSHFLGFYEVPMVYLGLVYLAFHNEGHYGGEVGDLVYDDEVAEKAAKVAAREASMAAKAALMAEKRAKVVSRLKAKEGSGENN